MTVLSPAQAAQRAYDNGNLEEAIQLWTKLVLEKKKAVYYCLIGAAAKKLERWSEAEHAFREAQALDPKDRSVLDGLGTLYLDRKDGDREQNLVQARDCFLAALAIEQHVWTWTFLGVACLNLEQIQVARNAFEEALRLDNNYEEALYNLALIDKDVDDPKAITLLERAIEIDPNYSIAHQELGKLYQHSDDFARAEHHFRRSLDTDPTNYWSYLFLANLLAVQGKNVEAEQEYRKAMDLRPHDAVSYKYFADFLDQLSRAEEAQELRSKLANLQT